MRSNKTLVLDLYTFSVLTALKQYTPALPPHADDHLRIFYIGKHAQDIVDHVDKKVLYQFAPRKIEIGQIVADRQDMVVKLPISAMDRMASRLAQDRPLSDVAFIYSMWAGYLEKDGKDVWFFDREYAIFHFMPLAAVIRGHR